MNAFLTERYHALRDFQKKALRDRLRDSPKALRLLDFLEARPDGKFSMPEAVNTIYNEAGESFAVRQNRFFKLRKKVQELIESPQEEGKSQVDLLPHEQEYLRCRERMNANHYTVARKSLVRLIEECQRRNIFELLPGAINSLLYCNQALNVTEETTQLCDALDEASALLHDLHRMQAIHRRMYGISSGRGDAAEVAGFMDRSAAIMRRHPKHIRFRIYHTFICMTTGTASLGEDLRPLGKLLSSMAQLLTKYPDVPCGLYEKHHLETTQYYLASSRAVYAFASGDAEGSYQAFTAAWDIVNSTPGFRVRKSESLFVNKITAEVATGRFRDAVRTAEALIEFHKVQHEEEKRLKGFSILAMIYSYGIGVVECPDSEFLLSKLDDYIRVLKKARSPIVCDAYSTKAIFLFMLGRFAEANRIMRKEENTKAFVVYKVPEYIELLRMSTSTPQRKVAELRRRIEAALDRETISSRRRDYARAQSLIGLLQQ